MSPSCRRVRRVRRVIVSVVSVPSVVFVVSVASAVRWVCGSKMTGPHVERRVRELTC